MAGIRNPVLKEEPLYGVMLKDLLRYLGAIVSNTEESALVRRLADAKLRLELDFYLELQKLMKKLQ